MEDEDERDAGEKKREEGDKKGNARRKDRRKGEKERKRREKETGMEDVARSWERRGERKEEEGEKKGKDRGKERKEGREGERTELEDGRREKKDRMEEMYPAPCFPHGLKEISMEFLDQHLLCTLWGGGRGSRKSVCFVRL